MPNPFNFENFTERHRFPLFAVIRKLGNALNDVAPKLGRVKYREMEIIVEELKDEAAVPRCQRCAEQMTAAYLENKITGWICRACTGHSNEV